MYALCVDIFMILSKEIRTAAYLPEPDSKIFPMIGHVRVAVHQKNNLRRCGLSNKSEA
jgi:hypothetical protein